MISQRVFSALLVAPLVLLAVYYGGLPFLAVLVLFAAFAWLELQQLVQQPVTAYKYVGLALLSLVLVLTFFAPTTIMPVLAGSLLVLLLVQLNDFQPNKWTSAALAITTFFYLALPLVHLLLLRTETGDWRFVALLLITTWGYDTCAFFTGIRFGRVRPWGKISPKKSLEGMLGGLLGSVLIAALLLFAIMQPGSNRTMWIGYSLLFGVVVGLLAHFGDLTESAIKRAYQAKDSGRFLPGHGGLLDRIDSVLFATIFVYYFVKYLVL
ncbi:MAG: phosphatidate cytidylyltransferase [Bacillota bacterium]|jgi:phosphatidate cytidylyltransferase